MRCAQPVAIPMNAMLRHNTGVHPGYLMRTILELITDEGIVGLGEVGGGDQRGALLKLKPRNCWNGPLRSGSNQTKGFEKYLPYLSNSRLYGGQLKLPVSTIMGTSLQYSDEQI